MKKGATSYKETSFGILPRKKLLDLEIQGNKKGLEFVFTLSKNSKDHEIDIPLVLKLHKISYAWIFPDWAGKFRKIQVQYSGKEAPSFFKVRELITNLCLDLKERIRHLPSRKSSAYIVEVVKLLAWFQHQFVYIHPFNDYNGRTARMLTVFLLLKLGLPAVEIKADTARDRKTYIKALQEADLGNYKPLEKLISQALLDNLQKQPIILTSSIAKA